MKTQQRWQDVLQHVYSVYEAHMEYILGLDNNWNKLEWNQHGTVTDGVFTSQRTIRRIIKYRNKSTREQAQATRTFRKIYQNILLSKSN